MAIQALNRNFVTYSSQRLFSSSSSYALVLHTAQYANLLTHDLDHFFDV